MQTQEIELRVEDDRTGLSPAALKQALIKHLFYLRGKTPNNATQYDYFVALIYLVRDRLLHRWTTTTKTQNQHHVKQVGYFTSTFLAVPKLSHTLINLGIDCQIRQVADEMGFDLGTLLQQQDEVEPSSTELAQLTTCHLDSLTTLQIPTIAYGIRYEFDLCRETCTGKPTVVKDKWQRFDGSPWEISRPEWAVNVYFGGTTSPYTDERGRFRVRWMPSRVVRGMPYDTPISGYKTNTVNTLRLWSATKVDSPDQNQVCSEGEPNPQDDITLELLIKALPNDHEPLHDPQPLLQQHYFFMSCSLQDAIRIHCNLRGQPLETLHEGFALQLNENYHAIAIPELMRLLMDEHGLDWDTAWHISQQIFTYTHHTPPTEELEQCSVQLFSQLLPRHLEIIYEINQRFLANVRSAYPEDEVRIQRMSLIDETADRFIRMSHLAFVGSRSVSSIAGLHTKLLKQESLRDFYAFFPEKFRSRSNRIAPDRFVITSNPQLSHLFTHHFGDRWAKNLMDLEQLEPLANTVAFRDEWRLLKQSIKRSFADSIYEQYNLQIDPDSLFDVHTKPIREYQRQHLSLLYIVTLYNRIKANPNLEITPRTFIFCGDPPPSCYITRLILQLIHAVANVVNTDADVCDRMKVLVLHKDDVPLSCIYAAADLVEQISVANEETFGIDSMKFALNGALTIGTLSSVNTDICNQIGEENCFLFGLGLDEVNALKASGYHPWNFYHNHRELQHAIDRIASGYFAHGNSELFKPLIDSILGQDDYLLLADYPFYVDCQDRLGQVYSDRDWWTWISILNVARIGHFSSDRVMQDYCRDIWNVRSLSN